MTAQAAARSRADRPRLTIRPLTPDLWPALEDLFGPNGAVSGCWCMYWRLGSAYAKRPRAKNKADFRKRVTGGRPAPGLLAFAKADNGTTIAVGWCQVTPRRELAWMEEKSRLKHDDGVAVWSLSCFYIRKGWRRKGVMSALIGAAVKAARQAGAPALEAYPLDPSKTPSAAFTGYVENFRRAGFETVARPTPARETMRLALKPVRAAAAGRRSRPRPAPVSP
jgi:GNAT superfamily N-acetyltransferase